MPLDLAIFRAINGMAGRSDALDALIIFCATYLIFVMAALVFAYVAVSWKTTHFEGRVENLAHAAWAVVIGALAQIPFAFFWFRARPFVALEEVIKLVDRMPTEKSFPSAHATLAFAIAGSIALRNRTWGNALLVLASFVAVARVAAGVHYPTDIVGGTLVGLAAAFLAAPIKKGIEPFLEFLPVFRKYKRRDV